MKIIINSVETQTEALTLASLSKELNLPETGVAVAVHSKMIPRTDWSDFQLTENCDILIIKAASGG